MKKKTEKTNALRTMERCGADYSVHNYGSSGAVAGKEVAASLSEDPDAVFKTLVTVGKSGTNYVFLVPVSAELDLRKAAKSVGEKSVHMIKEKELLPLTGYVHGGCSPIGMKKFFRTTIDMSASGHEHIFFSAGKIGLQIETTLEELSKVIEFSLDEIV